MEEKNQIYDFLKENNLTQLDQKTFEDKYSDPEKAKEIHSFFQENKLTELDQNAFHEKFLKKKIQEEPTPSPFVVGDSQSQKSDITVPYKEGQAPQGSIPTAAQTAETPTLEPQAADQPLSNDQPKTSKLGVVPAIEGQKESPYKRADDFILQADATIGQQKKQIEDFNVALQNPELDEQGKQLVYQEMDKLIQNNLQLTDQRNKIDTGLKKIKEKFKPSLPLGQESLMHLEKGAANLGEMIARTPAFIYDIAALPQNAIAELTGLPIGASSKEVADKYGIKNSVADYYKKQVDKIDENLPKYEKGIYDSFKGGDYANGFQQIGNMISESAPSTLALAMGGWAGAGLAPSMATGTAVFGAGKKGELEGREDLSETQKTANALMSGFHEMLWEQMGTVKLTNIAKDIIQKEGVEQGKKTLAKGLTETYEKVLRKMYPVTSAIHEGATEAATQLSQNITDKYTGVNKDVNVMEGVMDAFIGGAAMGGAMFTPVGIYDMARKKKVDELTKQKEVIESEIKNENISPETKDVLTTEFMNVNEKLNTEIEAEAKEQEKLTPDQRTELDGLNKQIEDKDKVIADENVSDETKKVVEQSKSELETEIKDKVKEFSKAKPTEPVAVESNPTEIIEPKTPITDENLQKKGRKEGLLKPTSTEALTDEELQSEFDNLSNKIDEAEARQKKSNTAIVSTPENLLSEKDFIRFDDVKNELSKRQVVIAQKKVTEARAKRKAEVAPEANPVAEPQKIIDNPVIKGEKLKIIISQSGKEKNVVNVWIQKNGEKLIDSKDNALLSATFVKQSNGKYQADFVGYDRYTPKEYQRKGLATKLYDFMDDNGFQTEPSKTEKQVPDISKTSLLDNEIKNKTVLVPQQSEAGKKFWENRLIKNRQKDKIGQEVSKEPTVNESLQVEKPSITSSDGKNTVEYLRDKKYLLLGADKKLGKGKSYIIDSTKDKVWDDDVEVVGNKKESILKKIKEIENEQLVKSGKVTEPTAPKAEPIKPVENLTDKQKELLEKQAKAKAEREKAGIKGEGKAMEDVFGEEKPKKLSKKEKKSKIKRSAEEQVVFNEKKPTLFRKESERKEVKKIVSESEIKKKEKKRKEIAQEMQGFELKEEGWLDRLKKAFQNKYNRINNLQRDIKASGKSITDDIDVEMAVELFQGKAKQKLNKLSQEIVEGLPENKGKSLFERMAKDKIDLDEYGLYLYAKHAPERNAKVAETRQKLYDDQLLKLNKKLSKATEQENKSLTTRYTNEILKLEKQENKNYLLMPEGGSGMTDKQATEILSEIDKSGKKELFEKYEKEVREKLIDKFINETDAYKLLDSQSINNIKSAYKYYVPLKVSEKSKGKSFPTGRSFDVKGKDIYKAKGSTKYDYTQRENPLFQSLIDISRTIIRGEKNEVDRAFLKLVRENPNPEVFNIVKPKYTPKFNKEGEIEYVYRQYNPSENINTLELKDRNGKPILIEIKDKALFDAIKGNGVQRSIKFLATLNSYLRSVNTIYNPEFVFSNFVRDLQTASINISSIEGQSLQKEMIKNIPSAMKGIWQTEKGNTNSSWSKTVQDFRDSGGEIGWFDLKDVEDYVDDLRVKAKKYNSDKTLDKLGSALNTTLKYIDRVNKTVEMGVRVAAYKALIDNGVSSDKAAQFAKNLTVNFEKKGNWGAFIDSFYLFANAGIQGSAVIMTNMYKSPKIRKIVGATIIGSFLINLLNRWINEDEYDKIDDGIKERNIIFMMPNGNYIKIPLPYGYNVFKVIGDVSYEVVNGKKSFWEGAKKMLLATNNAFNPLSSANLSQALSPTITDPIVQQTTNQNWFNAPIKPEQQPYQPLKPESQLYFKSVRPISREISEWINKETGGSLIKSGNIDISPEILDHYIDFLGGGLARSLANGINAGYDVSQGEIPKINNIPFARTFLGNPNESVDLKTIYETLKESGRTEFNEKEQEKFYKALENSKTKKTIDDKEYLEFKKDFKENQRILQLSKKYPDLDKKRIKETKIHRIHYTKNTS